MNKEKEKVQEEQELKEKEDLEELEFKEKEEVKEIEKERKETKEEEEEETKKKERKKEDPEIVEERVRRFYNHKAHPLFPNLSKEGIEKAVSMSLDLNKNGLLFFESKYYLDLIPSDGSKWAFNPLSLQNATTEQHEEMLNNFFIPDDDHKYSPDIKQGLSLFHKWRKYRNKKEWKFLKKENKIKIYSHESSNGLTVVKGEAALSYSTPIILGILLNPEKHKIDKDSQSKIKLIEPLSLFSFAIYSRVKTPFLVNNRELCMVTFIYTFRDGSVLFGARSINHDKYPIQSKPIRGQVNLSLWHIRPRYNKSLQASKITYYVQMDLKGSIPKAVTKKLEIAAQNRVFHIASYLISIEDKLCDPGVLSIPPYPILKNLGIDIGWMDRDINATDSNSLVIQTKDYVFKSMDHENHKIICFDEDFNDIVFDVLNDKLLKKIQKVIQDGTEKKKDVTITVVQKKKKNADGAKIVCDAKIND